MTRVERAREREQRRKDQLAAATRQRTQLEAQEHARLRAKQLRRRQQVGTLADEAGLLAWDDATLAAVFAVLARLREASDPDRVLENLLTIEFGLVD